MVTSWGLVVVLAASPAFQRLYVSGGEATSFLKSNWNKFEENYHPSYAFDDDPATAWVEGRSGDGIGEALRWEVSPLKAAHAVQLKLRNGYQKSAKLFAANARPKSIELTVLGARRETVATKTFELKDAMGWQELSLALPPKSGLSGFILEVRSVYPGKTYQDTCLSDVQVFVESKEPYAAQAELAKKHRLASWAKERRDAAKYFAKLPAPYPVAATRLSRTGDVIPEIHREGGKDFPLVSDLLAAPAKAPKLVAEVGAEPAERAAALRQELEKLKSDATWQQAVFKQHFTAPEMDGADPEVMRRIVDFVDLANVSFFEVKKAVAAERRPAKSQDAYLQAEVVTNAKVRKSASGAVDAVYFGVTSTYLERSLYTDKREYLLTFDEKGLLREVFVWAPRDAQAFESGNGFQLWRFDADARGKLAKLAAVAVDDFVEDESSRSFNVRRFELAAAP